MVEKEIIYKPEGVCAKYIKVKVEENSENREESIIKEVAFFGGCPGNAIGLALAVQERDVKTIMEMLKDVKCGSKETSCPAQLSKALEEYVKDIERKSVCL